MSVSPVGAIGVAVTALEGLRAALAGYPAAHARSNSGTPSTVELLDQWALRVRHGDMAPEAVPTLMDRQARRHHYHSPTTAAVIERAEVKLRACLGQRTGYGAPWYFGPGVSEDDD